METVKLSLSDIQLNKIHHGKTFQMNNAQLRAAIGLKKRGHVVLLQIAKTKYNQLIRNAKGSSRGFRFSPDIIHGGTLLDETNQ